MTDKINRARQISKFKRKNKRDPKPNDILYTLEPPLLEDVWDDCPEVYRLKEKMGYETQKPEKLIKRILECFSNEDHLICDFFGGGGTTAKVAFDLNRRFITGDISPVAVRVIKDRLTQVGCKDFIDCNPYLTKDEWRNIKGHTFADKVCEYMGWISNPRKSGDGGIDGWANDTKTIPVQIKNSAVNPSVIRDLAGVCSGAYKSGIVVGWSFSKDCYEFVSKLEKKTKIRIELKQADTIVKPIDSMKKAEWQKLYKERINEQKKEQAVADDKSKILQKALKEQQDIDKSKRKKKKI